MPSWETAPVVAEPPKRPAWEDAPEVGDAWAAAPVISPVSRPGVGLDFTPPGFEPLEYAKIGARGLVAEGLGGAAQGTANVISRANLEARYPEYADLSRQLLELDAAEKRDAQIAERAITRPSEYADFPGMSPIDVIGRRTKEFAAYQERRGRLLARMSEIESQTAPGMVAETIGEGRQAVRELLPVNRDIQESISGKIVSGLGQAGGSLPFYLIPAVGQVIGPATSVAQIYQEGYDDALQSGASPAEAHDAAMRYVPASALDILGDKLVVGRFLKPFVGQKIGRVLADLGGRAVGEGATETGQQAWLNVVASELSKYDPERPLSQDLVDSFIVGTAVGGVSSGALEVARTRQEAGARVEQAAQAVAAAQQQQQAAQQVASEPVVDALDNPEASTLADVEARQQQIADAQRVSQQATRQAGQSLERATAELEQAATTEQQAELQGAALELASRQPVSEQQAIAELAALEPAEPNLTRGSQVVRQEPHSLPREGSIPSLAPTRPVAPVQYVGEQQALPAEMRESLRLRYEQEGMSPVAAAARATQVTTPLQLYNIIEPIEGIDSPVGSTVAGQTLEAAGYALPPRSQAGALPAGTQIPTTNQQSVRQAEEFREGLEPAPAPSGGTGPVLSSLSDSELNAAWYRAEVGSQQSLAIINEIQQRRAAGSWNPYAAQPPTTSPTSEPASTIPLEAAQLEPAVGEPTNAPEIRPVEQNRQLERVETPPRGLPTEAGSGDLAVEGGTVAPAPDDPGTAAPPLQRGLIARSRVGQWADRVLRERGPGSGALNTLDPQVAFALAVRGAELIESGVRRFADWAGRMADQFADLSPDDLAAIYRQADSIARRIAAGEDVAPPEGPPTQPETPPAQEDGKTRERTVTRKLSEGRGLAAEWSEAARKTLEDRRYEVRGMERVRREVEAIMAEGFDAARAEFEREHSGFPPDVRIGVAAAVIEELYARGQLDQWEQAINRAAELGTSMGQGINMFKAITGSLATPRGAQAFFQQSVNRAKKRLGEGAKAGEVSETVAQVVNEAVANNPEMRGVQAILRVLGRRTSIRDAIRVLLGENRTELWQRYKDQISDAVRGALKPRGGNPALLQLFSRDIARILTEKLPKPQGPAQPTAQETAQQIETILRNPEKFREALVQAKLDLQNDPKITPELKRRALEVLESFVAGESPVNRMIERLIRQVFDELDTNPRALARQGSVRNQEIRATIQRRVAELFGPAFAREMVQRVDSTVAAMLADAREQLRVAFQSREIRQAFGLQQQVDEADRLLASGTEEEIRAFLNDRLPSETSQRIEDLRKALNERRDQLRLRVLTPAEIERRVMARLKQRNISKPSDLRTTIGQAVDLFNEGKLTARGLEELITKRFPLAGMTPAIAERLANFARRIASTPQNSAARRDATIDLFDFVHEQIQPITGTDIGLALFYAHILAGYPTHIRNIVSNLTSAADLGLDFLLSNPRQWADRIDGLLRGGLAGVRHGAGEAVELVRSGRRAINEEEIKWGESPTLERTRFRGVARPYNASKFVGRLLRAEDVFQQATVYEIKARQVAWEMAREMAASGKIRPEQIAAAVESLLNNSPQQIADHRAQAEQEFAALHPDLQVQTPRDRWIATRTRELQSLSRDRQLVERATDLATRSTFNYRPEGLAGFIANPLIDAMSALRRAGREANTGSKWVDRALRLLSLAPRIEIPFIRIPANLYSRAGEYAGLSIVPLVTGYELRRSGAFQFAFERLTPDQRALMGKRMVAGWTILGLMAALGWPTGDEDEERKRGWRIHGRGPRTIAEGRARYGPKWKPYSIEVVHKDGSSSFFPYTYTPIGPALAAVGALHDGERHQLFTTKEGELRLAHAMGSIWGSMMNQTFMRQAADIADALVNPGESSDASLSRALARTTVSPLVQTALPLANLWKSLENDFDPNVRDTTGLRASLLSNLVGGRALLRPRLDMLGDEMENRPFDWLFSTSAANTPEARIYRTFADRNVDPGDGSRWKSKLGDKFYDFFRARQQAIKRELLADGEALLRELGAAPPAEAERIMRDLGEDATQEALDAVDYVRPEPEEEAGAGGVPAWRNAPAVR